jgi:hypothetical protein
MSTKLHFQNSEPTEDTEHEENGGALEHAGAPQGSGEDPAELAFLSGAAANYVQLKSRVGIFRGD